MFETVDLSQRFTTVTYDFTGVIVFDGNQSDSIVRTVTSSDITKKLTGHVSTLTLLLAQSKRVKFNFNIEKSNIPIFVPPAAKLV